MRGSPRNETFIDVETLSSAGLARAGSEDPARRDWLSARKANEVSAYGDGVTGRRGPDELQLHPVVACAVVQDLRHADVSSNAPG